ncbi:MAG: outer membrane protein (OmpH-like) [Crocinitomicaceae bacterium]|jgi:outer membrane protein|nr:outer membrane protein (OmpH-like) [Crocinitomicaceae bacterium]
MIEQIKKVAGKEVFGKLSLLVSVVLLILYISNGPGSGNMRKIGIVQMEKVVYDFKGMKEATKDFTGKMDSWSAETDSLKKKLEFFLYEIKLDSINGDKAKLEKDKQKFLLLRSSYIELQQKLTQQSQQEDQQMTIGVVNQLKQYMKEYAEENGYDLIISNTQMENVGYVGKSFDITDEVLSYANKKYEGEN